jgi:AcrR family transcriptional regulator
MTALLDEGSRPAPGLRERKKAKTRAAIQRHALQLFREQGYEATTVEQIAAAAEVSPSTFFRYFPTKEDVVLYDPFDPVLIAAVEAQPPLLSPMQAIRKALHATFAAMSGEDRAEQWERGILILSNPEVRMRMLDDFLATAQVLSELVASRMGRHPDDLAVRTFVGGVIGALMAAFLAGMNDPTADVVALMDESLRLLEAGLPL